MATAAAATSVSSTAPVLLRPCNFRWYWNSATGSWSTSSEEQWQKYTDVENEIIEDASNEKKDEVEIDGGYVINLKLMSQYNKLDNSNPRPIKRVQLQTNRNNDHIREERFSLPIRVSSISLTSTSSQNDEEQEWRGTGNCGLTYQVLELAKKNKNIAYVVEEAAQGIIKEGEGQGKIKEACWLAEQLRKVKVLGDSVTVIEYETAEIPSVIGQTCVYLYTKESFWYKCFNKVMQDPRNVTREHVKTLGPFSFLLHNYLQQIEKYEIPTVFRGVDLTDEQRLKFMDNVTFSSFTSTSKSRPLAEFYDRNTLLIIDLNIKKTEGLDVSRAGAYISDLSDFQDEEEFLIWPQTWFHVLRHEYDKKKNKHIIYLKSSQTNS